MTNRLNRPRHLELPDVWQDLDEPEAPRHLDTVRPGLYTCVAPLGWNRFCKWGSSHLPGQWWPKETGCTWQVGRRCAWFNEVSMIGRILDAVECARSFGLEPGWSIGSAARCLLRWIGKSQRPLTSDLALLHDTGRSYQDCRPGVYDGATLYDAAGYYFGLWTRLPCLRVHVHSSGRLLWHHEPAQETRRRWDVADAVKERKLLRNAIVGCSTGKAAGTRFWHRGVCKTIRFGPGLFRASGLLVCRTGWELTHRASLETDSVYSNVDCVVSLDGLYPQVWDDYGVAHEAKARGHAVICNPICYKVGHRETKWYTRGSRLRETLVRPGLTPYQWCDQWLTRRAG